ncbi:hypothetical protein QFC19_004224 [Naganishia cerealis]|uniref:Uncharacterized protein n=1 Tax=Naganishia cerealis TaxID=610337 RepID=A0ACC2VXE3_9TREE|nr:hypothetical protein QFC19_004224 [Naganishia cerealis]
MQKGMRSIVVRLTHHTRVACVIIASLMFIGLVYICALLVARVQQDEDLARAREEEEGLATDKVPNLYRPGSSSGSSGTSTEALDETEPLLIDAT